MDETEMTIAAAELLEEALAFKESKLWAYMLTRRDEVVNEAQKKLSNVDASDSKAIRQLQNQIWRAESFEQWLDEAIDIGDSAVEVWRQQQSEAA